MKRSLVFSLALVALAGGIVAGFGEFSPPVSAQSGRATATNVAVIPHEAVPFFKHTPGIYLGEVMGIATNSKGNVYVYHRANETRLFEYTPQGRRDPFISLVNRGKDQSAQNGGVAAKRAEGVPGMLTGELTVRGIMQARGAWVAMVSGPDGKVYTVRAGDKLADGVVRQVNAASVVILQEVNDPLSLEKQREVRKFLRGGDEVK